MKKVTLFIILLLAGSLLFAQGPGGGGGKKGRGHKKSKGMHMFMNDRLLEEAGISEAVRADVRKARHEVELKVKDLHFKINELRILSRKESQNDTLDIQKLKKTNASIADLHKQQMLLMGNFRIDQLSKFTVEQRKKIMSLMKDKRKRFMKRMGDGREKNRGGRK